MNGEIRSGGSARAAVLVAAVTLLAVALPATAPLSAQVYPANPDAKRLSEALVDADVEAGFTPSTPTQYEQATFTATVIYGTAITPSPQTIKVGYSNEARLEAKDEDTFIIDRTSTSDLFLDQGQRRPDGAFELTWTWEVTPLVSGEQSLELIVIPTVTVGGRSKTGQDINRPITVEVDVNPAARDFGEVLSAAADMETELPDEMTVGEQHDVSAAMSLAGHADTVSADLTLVQGERSAEVTITEASAAPGALATVASTASAPQDRLLRRWVVIPDEPGQVDLVFTALVTGQAAEQQLEQDVQVVASARAVEPGASFWDLLQKPILYLTPFIALAAMLLGLWTAWSKRSAATAAAEGGSSGEPPQDAAPSGEAAP